VCAAIEAVTAPASIVKTRRTAMSVELGESGMSMAVKPQVHRCMVRAPA
jgi:hypothetical protein